MMTRHCASGHHYRCEGWVAIAHSEPRCSCPCHTAAAPAPLGERAERAAPATPAPDAYARGFAAGIEAAACECDAESERHTADTEAAKWRKGAARECAQRIRALGSGEPAGEDDEAP